MNKQIVYPDKKGEGQSETRRSIYSNPNGWEYSYDGIQWEKCPMDIGKISYSRAMFRKEK